jgi:hypothetical protein
MSSASTSGAVAVGTVRSLMADTDPLAHTGRCDLNGSDRDVNPRHGLITKGTNAPINDGIEIKRHICAAREELYGFVLEWLPWRLIACPPEDVGGSPGYLEFLEAIINPSHNEHQQMLEWCGGSSDAFDLKPA